MKIYPALKRKPGWNNGMFSQDSTLSVAEGLTTYCGHFHGTVLERNVEISNENPRFNSTRLLPVVLNSVDSSL